MSFSSALVIAFSIALSILHMRATEGATPILPFTMRLQYHSVDEKSVAAARLDPWQTLPEFAAAMYITGRKGALATSSWRARWVLGHESSGVVVEAGAKVRNVKVGDRVAIEPGVPCRRCIHCRSGYYNLCVFAATPPHDGTLQKYYIVACDFVYPIPEHMTAEDGAVQVNKVADLRAGQTVLVFG
ncbi:GroES-like protein [Metarhizium rileyi]|uniref:D-xylulose reductase n=1 Tax=Metarhizium rileyi (strain RCEF 4871) TaxID=1649241 RepID=A0A167JR49_METRR|nr:GroES-like protein [Metarhizium rileyi RCEF 4871]